MNKPNPTWLSIARKRYFRRLEAINKIDASRKVYSAAHTVVDNRTYNEKDVGWFLGGFDWDDCDCPVVMRGSIRRLAYKHSLSSGRDNPAGLAIAVIRRYFRAARITCFDSHQYFALCNAAYDKMLIKHPRIYESGKVINYLLSTTVGSRFGEYGCYIKGRHHDLTEHQFNYLSRLNCIRKKICNVEKRMEKFYV